LKEEIFINNIIKNTKVEGPGIRHGLWLQGCEKKCKGCFAKHTWDIESGQKFTVKDVVSELSDSEDGITISGGEPFLQAKSVFNILDNLKTKSVILFTGFTMEEILENKNIFILKCINKIDVLITGRYVQENPEKSRPFVGSENQRFWFLTNKYSWDDFKQLKNSIEIRIKNNGNIVINGMENPENIKMFSYSE